jgi:hypothetical protein
MYKSRGCKLKFSSSILRSSINKNGGSKLAFSSGIPRSSINKNRGCKLAFFFKNIFLRFY